MALDLLPNIISQLQKLTRSLAICVGLVTHGKPKNPTETNTIWYDSVCFDENLTTHDVVQ